MRAMTDEEMTRLLAEKVMGWKVTTNPAYARRMVGDRQPVICDVGESDVYAPGGGYERWRPLERIDHAWQVRDRLAELGSVQITSGDGPVGKTEHVSMSWFPPETNFKGSDAYEDTVARAICLAALRAVGEDV